MPGSNLVHIIEHSPQVAWDSFTTLDVAVNTVLPGSDTHSRYIGIEEVGLAITVGRDSATQSYNPLQANVLTRLTFGRDNKDQHPAAWEPKDGDDEILGAPMPLELGRFMVFSLAKLDYLREIDGLSSYRPEGVSVAPGKVGFAGGRRVAKSMTSTSGLWEVHDHVASGVYATEVVNASAAGASPRTADELAEELDKQFSLVQRLHDGVRAEDLSRNGVAKLLALMNQDPILGTQVVSL